MINFQHPGGRLAYGCRGRPARGGASSPLLWRPTAPRRPSLAPTTARMHPHPTPPPRAHPQRLACFPAARQHARTRVKYGSMSCAPPTARFLRDRTRPSPEGAPIRRVAKRPRRSGARGSWRGVRGEFPTSPGQRRSARPPHPQMGPMRLDIGRTDEFAGIEPVRSTAGGHKE